MKINVYDKEAEKVVQIESSKFDSTKHFHRNTQGEFTKEDLNSFGLSVESAVKSLEKLNKVALLEKVAELGVEGITEDNTKKEIIEAIEEFNAE